MKHIIKKVISIVAVYLFVLVGAPFALANAENDTGKVYMSPEYQAEVEELKEKVEDYLENKVTPYSGSYVVRNVPCYMQEGNSSVARVYYNDPHYNSDHYGSYDCDISQMRTCIHAHAGYYIMSS